jgi:hypothetical protein
MIALKSWLADRWTSLGANGYSAAVLSSHTEIRQLRDVASKLMRQEDPMLAPDFFLASVSKEWWPRVVVVYHEREAVGIMYTKERIIYGIPTGVVYSDGGLGGILLANPLHYQKAFSFAVEVLLASPGIRGLRLEVARSGEELEAVRQLSVSRSVHSHYSRIEYQDFPIGNSHAHLLLPDTYDQFLAGLGSTTRHNFRYYRRRFQASGHRFEEHLSIDELRSATLDLRPKSKLTAQRQQCKIERDLNMVAAASQPLAVGLKHHNGEWLAVIGGWYRPGVAVLCFQCNNERDFGPDSLSVVLRAHLMELLIRRRLEELVIWHGTRGPLSRYVTYVPVIGVRLDKPTYSWRLVRWLISTVGPRLPRRFADAAQWIA